MTRSRGIASATATMFSGTLVSRVLGFVRGGLIAVALSSAGGAAASFAVANTLPNTIYMLLAGGVINAVLVPQLVRAARLPDGGREYTDRLLTVATAGLFVVTVVLTLGAGLLVRLYANQMSADWLPVAYAFAYWCVPQVFFYGLYTLLGQVLNARSVFGPYMWAPVVNNVVAIVGLVVYLRQFGAMPTNQLTAAQFGADRIVLLGATATLGVALQAIVLVVPLWRAGFRYRPRWGLAGLGGATRMGGWTFAALAVGQVGFLAVSNVAAAAGARGDAAGSIYADNATYQLAFTVFMLPQSLVVVSLVTAMFTRLSEKAAARDRFGVRSDLSFTMRTVSVFTVIATAVVILGAHDLANLITLGSQEADRVSQLSHVIVGLAVGIPALGLWSAVQRVYYAYEDARSLFWIQVVMAVVVAGGSFAGMLLLSPSTWVVGAALAIAASYVLGSVIGYLGLRRHLPSIDGARVFRTHLRLVLAVVPPVVVGVLLGIVWTGGSLAVSAVRLMLLALVMGAAYLATGRALRISEVSGLMDRAARLLARVGPLTDRLRTMVSARTSRAGTTERGAVTQLGYDAVAVGLLLADRYRVDQQVDSAIPGIAAWQGRDTILERRIDVLSVAPERANAVLDGARRTSLLSDPRLPKVLRVGEHEGTGYVVLEPFAARTLAQVLDGGGHLPPDVARSIAGEVASALETGRRRGVHHLGLVPELVGFTSTGGVRVAGLGLVGPAGGLAPSSTEAARADARAVADLYATMTGADAAPVADGELHTASNVVVALAPWAAVPPLAELGALAAPAAGSGAPDPAGATPAPGRPAEPSSGRPTADLAVGTPLAGAVVGSVVEPEHDADLAELASLEGDEVAVADVTAGGIGASGDEDAEDLVGVAGAAGEPGDAAVSTASDGDEELRELAAVDGALVDETASFGGAWQPAMNDLSAPPTFGAVLAGSDAAGAAGPAGAAGAAGAATPTEQTAGATDDPTTAPSAVAAAGAGLAGVGAAVAGWLRRLDAAVPAAERPAREGGTVAEGAAGTDASAPGDPSPAASGATAAPVTPPAPVADSSAWTVHPGEGIAKPPAAFDEAIGQWVDNEAPGEPAALDGVATARHGSGAAVAAALAWFQGHREVWGEQRAAAAQRRQVERAEREKAAAEQAERDRVAAAERAERDEQERIAAEQAAHEQAERDEAAAAALAAAPPAAAADPAPEWVPTGSATTVLPGEPVAPTRAIPAVAPGASEAAGTAPAPTPTPVPEAPVPPARPADDRAERDAAAYQVPVRRRGTWGTINATPFVLLLVLAGVVWVFFAAIGSLVDAARSGVSDETPTPAPSPSPTAEAGAGSDPFSAGVLEAALDAAAGTTTHAASELTPGHEPGPADLPAWLTSF